MVYEIRRGGGILVALAAVGVMLAGCGAILHAALDPIADRLRERDQTFMVSVSYEIAARRMLGILRDRPPEGPRPSQKLGVLLGPSVLQQGVDPALLTKEMGGAYRWSNLRLPAQTEDNRRFAEWMYASGLRPDALVLVTNAGIQISDLDTQAEAVWYDPRILFDHLAHGKWELARADLIEITMIPWRYAFPYRGHVFTAVDRTLYATKLAMCSGRKSPFAALYRPEPDPYVEPFPVGPPRDDLSDRFILGFIGRKGWFDASRYRTDTRNYRQLVELFQIAHAHGTRTFLVLVPESTPYRERMPANSADPILRGFPRDLGAAAPLVFDYRKLLSEREFADVNHPNHDGRIVETRRLARDLRSALGLESAPAANGR